MKIQRGPMFLVIAIILGAAAAFVAQKQQAPPIGGEATKAETVEVLVARTDLATASILTARHLDSVAWPKAYLPQGALTQMDQAEERVLKRPMVAGEPLLESALFPLGTAAGLGALIEPKRRALSVKVDPVIGVAGFVKPGAHVDVLVTARRVDQRKPVPYSKAILQDVKVLAVDQKLEQAKNGDPEIVNVVTLEVTPKDGEKLTYASHQGKLQLAMRNPSDDEKVESYSINVADLMGGRKRARASRPRSNARVQVLRGSSLKVSEF
jgi:pilus assembly protein CpaB